MAVTSRPVYRLRRRRFLSLTVAAAIAAVVRAPRAPAKAETGPTRTVLPNGLVVIVEERQSANTVALRLTARAGSRDDGPLPGITVITSRMMFQGTGRRPSETALQRTISLVGGTLTRGTSMEWSFFASVVPANEVELGFDLLSDLVLDPLLTPDALARQKRIALQEQAQRRADPTSLLADLFQIAMFAGHPLGTPIIGTPESIDAVTQGALLANRQRLWGASNLVLSVVGRIQHEDALDKAWEYFRDLPPGTKNERPAAPVQPPEGGQSVWGEVGQQQVQFRVGFAAPALVDADRYPLLVLDSLMGGPSGRLFAELRSARGLAYIAGSAYLAFSDGGTWFVEAGVEPQHLDAALEVVWAEIQRLRDTLPDDGEVARQISQIAGQQIVADETNAARAGRLAAQEVLGSEPTEELVRRVRQVDPAAVQRVARSYLDPDRALLVVVGPQRG